MERTVSKEYRLIGQRLIRTRPELYFIKENNIKIAYLECDQAKKKNKKIVMADCTKVDDKYTWCCKYHFFITVYTTNCEHLTDKQKEILILHELYHVGLDDEGNEPVYYIVPHDQEEFDRIIDEFGLHWARDGDS